MNCSKAKNGVNLLLYETILFSENKYERRLIGEGTSKKEEIASIGMAIVDNKNKNNKLTTVLLFFL